MSEIFKNMSDLFQNMSDIFFEGKPYLSRATKLEHFLQEKDRA